MVRFLLTLLAAAGLVLTPLAGAQAKARRAAASASHHAKKAEPKTHAKGRGRGSRDEDESPRGKRGAHRGAAGREAAACKPARGRHGRGHARACVSNADDEPEGRDDRRGPAHGKVLEEDCVRVTVHPRGRHGARGRARTEEKCTERYVRASEPPHEEEKPAPIIVAPAPDSPAEIVKHAPPGPGIVSATNADVWAQRRQAEHRKVGAEHLTAATLTGRSDTELKAALGMPDLERNEGAGALWTYRLPACSLMVFLKRDGAEPLKVTGAQASPLQRGGPVPDVDACLRSASSGR
jgi:hypothetical protein